MIKEIRVTNCGDILRDDEKKLVHWTRSWMIVDPVTYSIFFCKIARLFLKEVIYI